MVHRGACPEAEGAQAEGACPEEAEGAMATGGRLPPNYHRGYFRAQPDKHVWQPYFPFPQAE